jgi:DNA-binding LytR/AlgR family response regulator
MPNIEINTTEGNKNILVEDIYYFEYCDRHVSMVTKQGIHILKQSLSQVEVMMNPFGFAMPHKSFLVNLLHVTGINGYTIFMADGCEVPLSQKKSVVFRRQLNGFIEKQIKVI